MPRYFGYLSTLWARNVQPAGVNVEYKYFPVFTDMLTALNAGQIDLTEFGDVGAVQSYVTVAARSGDRRHAAQLEELRPDRPQDEHGQELRRSEGGQDHLPQATNSYIMFLHQLQAAG